MKTLFLFFSTICLSTLMVFSQELNDIEFVSPFHDGYAAIQKDNKWAFIDEQGMQVMDWRDDLVMTTCDGLNYPVLNSKRCLIVQVKNGISYFGYIDEKGNTILKPQYLNATNFIEGLAVVLELNEEVLGTNELLDKRIVDYTYRELIINPDGEVAHFLQGKPKHITLDKKFVKSPPKILTKILSDQLFATMNTDMSWSIKKL